MRKWLPVAGALALGFIGYRYWQATAADPARVIMSVYTQIGWSGVANTGSMLPTLNGDSILIIESMRVGDIRPDMIVIADVGGLVVAKRVEDGPLGWHLVGDNRDHSSSHIFNGNAILGVVTMYTTDGVTYRWINDSYKVR